MEGVTELFKHATITVVDLYHRDLHFEAQLELYLAFSFAKKHQDFGLGELWTKCMWFYGLLN